MVVHQRISERTYVRLRRKSGRVSARVSRLHSSRPFTRKDFPLRAANSRGFTRTQPVRPNVRRLGVAEPAANGTRVGIRYAGRENAQVCFRFNIAPPET